MLLQTKLKKLGYEVGEIDGILGSKTRRSVQELQRTLNLPADAWPTIELLETLQKGQATKLSAFFKSTETNWLTPCSCIVTPNSLSILDIVIA